MLKMKKMMMVVMIILTVCLVFAMSLEVKATGTTDNPITLDDIDISTGDDEPTEDANAVEANSIVANQIEANSQAGASQVIQPETNTTDNENTLPQAGVTEDITVMFFIIVCVVSAIYAYKKIRDYNV